MRLIKKEFSDNKDNISPSNDKKNNSHYWRNRIGIGTSVIGGIGGYRLGSKTADLVIDDLIKNPSELGPGEYKELMKNTKMHRRNLKIKAGTIGALAGGGLALGAGALLGYAADRISPDARRKKNK